MLRSAAEKDHHHHHHQSMSSEEGSLADISSLDPNRLSPKLDDDDNSKVDPPQFIYHLEGGQEIITTQRACPKVIPARAEIPSDEQIFLESSSKPNVTFLRTHFCEEGKLSNDQLLRILQMGTEVLKAEPNVLRMDAPIIGK